MSQAEQFQNFHTINQSNIENVKDDAWTECNEVVYDDESDGVSYIFADGSILQIFGEEMYSYGSR